MSGISSADYCQTFYKDNARWLRSVPVGYDPSLGRFHEVPRATKWRVGTQADSIIPPGVQGLDRYAYGLNNPSRFTDPSGHVVCEVGEPCGTGATYVPETSMEDAVKHLKDRMKDIFGITLSDDGGGYKGAKAWDAKSISLLYGRLLSIDILLKGKLKSIIEKAGGAIFDRAEYSANFDIHGEGCPPAGCSYSGYTDGTHITFFTTGNRSIYTMNFYHEFGHLMNSLPGKDNIFSNQLAALKEPSFIINNHVNTNALLGNFAEPIQASTGEVTEQWGDVFANYAAGNINVNNPAGAAMYEFISPALDVFLAGY